MFSKIAHFRLYTSKKMFEILALKLKFLYFMSHIIFMSLMEIRQ